MAILNSVPCRLQIVFNPYLNLYKKIVLRTKFQQLHSEKLTKKAVHRMRSATIVKRILELLCYTKRKFENPKQTRRQKM